MQLVAVYQHHRKLTYQSNQIHNLILNFTYKSIYYTSFILSFGCQLCSYKVELMAHNAELTPLVNGKFGSHKLLLSSKSTASLFPLAIAKLKGDCPFKLLKLNSKINRAIFKFNYYFLKFKLNFK